MGERATDDVLPLLRLLAEQSTEHAVVLLDPQGQVLWWSAGAERILGYAAGEITGDTLERIFTPEDRARAMPVHELRVALETGVAHDDRWQLRRDGSRIWVNGFVIPLRDAAGRHVAFAKLMRNRTDMKEQLESVRSELLAREQEIRRRDAFLSTLSHELRNPMAPLANAVQIIRMSGAADPGTEYALKVIDRQVDLLRRLVDDLLDLVRIGSGKIELRRQAMPLREVLEAALDAARPGIAAREHRLECVMPEAPIEVDVDRERMGQVFVNLLNNATKYTPPGGEIHLVATAEAGEAVVRVSDNGIGIAPEILPRIFEMFTQAEGARSMAPGGLGIGLSLVHDLVRQHGGSVQARSDGAGKGAEFTVRLPMASASSPR